MDIIAKVRTMNGGWECEQKAFAEKGFQVGQTFNVTSIDMGGFCTYIKLEGQEGSFNSVYFDFFDTITENKVDVYKDKRFNPYL